MIGASREKTEGDDGEREAGRRVEAGGISNGGGEVRGEGK